MGLFWRKKSQGVEEKVAEFSEAPELRIRTRFTRRRIVTGLFIFYAIFLPVYFYIGFQPTGTSASAFAEEAKAATGILKIPSIGLEAPMTDVDLDGRVLTAPKYIVGRFRPYENKVLVMGHSSTVFHSLKDVSVGDKIVYDGKEFKVTSRVIRAKADISMREILEDETVPTLVLMTCSGEHISGQDYSHRLILYAVQ